MRAERPRGKDEAAAVVVATKAGDGHARLQKLDHVMAVQFSSVCEPTSGSACMPSGRVRVFFWCCRDAVAAQCLTLERLLPLHSRLGPAARHRHA